MKMIRCMIRNEFRQVDGYSRSLGTYVKVSIWLTSRICKSDVSDFNSPFKQYHHTLVLYSQPFSFASVEEAFGSQLEVVHGRCCAQKTHK